MTDREALPPDSSSGDTSLGVLWSGESTQAAIQSAPSPIWQRGSHDCGVACVAMAAQVTYETAQDAFCALGLASQTRRGRIGKPFSSNFVELKAVLLHLGREVRMRRFPGWCQINTPSIVKVVNGHKRDWHWVFAIWDRVHGLHVLDPARLDIYLEIPPPGMFSLPLDTFCPKGSYLEFMGGH